MLLLVRTNKKTWMREWVLIEAYWKVEHTNINIERNLKQNIYQKHSRKSSSLEIWPLIIAKYTFKNDQLGIWNRKRNIVVENRVLIEEEKDLVSWNIWQES